MKQNFSMVLVTIGVMFFAFVFLNFVTFDINTHFNLAVTQVATTNEFRLLSPRGGEVWQVGSNQNIFWAGGDANWPIQISILSQDSRQLLRTLTTDLSNTGSTIWMVDMPPGDYKLVLKACAGCQTTSASAFSSGTFRIVPGPNLDLPHSPNPTNQSFVFYYPRGGETISAGGTMTVRWFGGTSDDVLVLKLYTAVPFQYYTVIADNLSNTGVYTWRLPTTTANDKYYLSIECKNCGSRSGSSAYTFYPITIRNSISVGY